MISLVDCIGLCGLTEAEIMAIAEHEHLPEIAAAAMASYICHEPQGSKIILKMIVDDIRLAQDRGDAQHVKALLHVLHHYLKSHPEAKPEVHPWSARF